MTMHRVSRAVALAMVFAVAAPAFAQDGPRGRGEREEQADERRAARKLKYDDIKMDLAGYVYQKKMRDRFEQFVADLRKKADVKVLIDLNKTDKG